MTSPSTGSVTISLRHRRPLPIALHVHHRGSGSHRRDFGHRSRGQHNECDEPAGFDRPAPAGHLCRRSDVMDEPIDDCAPRRPRFTLRGSSHGLHPRRGRSAERHLRDHRHTRESTLSNTGVSTTPVTKKHTTTPRSRSTRATRPLPPARHQMPTAMVGTIPTSQ